MSQDAEIEALVGNYYAPNEIIAAIPRATALLIGRLLTSKQYVKTAGCIVEIDSQQTVANLLRTLDDTARYSKDTAGTVCKVDNSIVGPYYSNEDGVEFCPQGIAVWQLDLEA
jgi:hypothetical protein